MVIWLLLLVMPFGNFGAQKKKKKEVGGSTVGLFLDFF
jgi:hypothetical protein